MSKEDLKNLREVYEQLSVKNVLNLNGIKFNKIKENNYDSNSKSN
ncbi:hypothetical protein [Leclercia adecarboxylata]